MWIVQHYLLLLKHFIIYAIFMLQLISYRDKFFFFHDINLPNMWTSCRTNMHVLIEELIVMESKSIFFFFPAIKE